MRKKIPKKLAITYESLDQKYLNIVEVVKPMKGLNFGQPMRNLFKKIERNTYIPKNLACDVLRSSANTLSIGEQ